MHNIYKEKTRIVGKTINFNLDDVKSKRKRSCSWQEYLDKNEKLIHFPK